MISISTLAFSMTILVVTFFTVDANVNTALACEEGTVNIRCRDGDEIKIISAYYGRKSRKECNANGDAPILTTNCVAINTFSIVEAECSNKVRCSVDASNAVFGEPCEGTYKYLKVEYECVDKPQTKKVVACEDSKLDIKCGRGEVIRVVQANYGRSNRRTCNNNGDGPILTTNCSAQRSLPIVRAKCGGKRECTVLASNDVFTEPCFGTIKYLKVEYFCQRKN